MKFNKILLLAPSYRGSFYEEPQPNPPVGLGYIAQSLENNGIPYSVIDMTLDYSVEDVINQIKQKNIDLLGISMMSFRYKMIYQMIKIIKKSCPCVAIVVGGPHTSTWQKRVLEDCPAVDFAVVGEGEYTIVELAKGMSLRKINGLIFRDRGQIIYNGQRRFIDDLDTIAFPRYEKFELEKYKTISVITSRGCPFRCIFCESKLIMGRKWRARSANNIVAEIEYWYEKGRRIFHFTEDNFTFNRARVCELCEELQKKAMKGIKFNIAGLRADKVDMELLKKMKDSGFRSLGIGVEGGNDKILKILKKGETIQTIKKSIEHACNLDFKVKLYFIIGSPYETWDDFKDSIKIAETYAVDKVNFYSMMPIPYTELFDWVKKEGSFLKSPDTYLNEDTPWSLEPFIDAPGMTVQEKKKALNLGLKIRRKITAKNLFSRRFGIFGIILTKIVFICPFIYDLIYKINIFKFFGKSMFRNLDVN